MADPQPLSGRRVGWGSSSLLPVERFKLEIKGRNRKEIRKLFGGLVSCGEILPFYSLSLLSFLLWFRVFCWPYAGLGWVFVRFWGWVHGVVRTWQGFFWGEILGFCQLLLQGNCSVIFRFGFWEDSFARSSLRAVGILAKANRAPADIIVRSGAWIQFHKYCSQERHSQMEGNRHWLLIEFMKYCH